MKRSRCFSYVGAITLVPGLTLARAQTSTFEAVVVPNGFVRPHGISSDGNVLVGESFTVAPVFGYRSSRWRRGLGFDDPGPSQGVTRSGAYCVSADGSAMGGSSGHAQFGDLEGWMRYGTSTGHVGSPSGHDTSECLALSRDGVVTVGYGGAQSNPNLFEAAYYTEQDDWTNLGFLPGGWNSAATAVDDDGSVIAGWSNTGYYTAAAWRWTASTGMVSLGNLATGNETKPAGMNSDGSVIVGNDYVGGAELAWSWTAAGGIQALPLMAGATQSHASAISADGTLVVGAMDVSGFWRPFVWDAAHGMLDLQDLLVQQGVFDAASYDFAMAEAIAGTGPYWITGQGGSPAGQNVVWIVSLTSLDVPSGATECCFGNASAGGACPCGNDGAPNEGCANSTGAGARLVASGGFSVAVDDLVLTATQLPAHKAGLIFMGGAPLNSGFGVPFGDGLRCMAAPYKRFGISDSGASGSFALTQPVAHANGWIWGGSVWSFQAWYRDPSGPCSHGTNLSSAVQVLFAP